jgi:hypothetical protein
LESRVTEIFGVSISKNFIVGEPADVEGSDAFTQIKLLHVIGEVKS